MTVGGVATAVVVAAAVRGGAPSAAPGVTVRRRPCGSRARSPYPGSRTCWPERRLAGGTARRDRHADRDGDAEPAAWNAMRADLARGR